MDWAPGRFGYIEWRGRVLLQALRVRELEQTMNESIDSELTARTVRLDDLNVDPDAVKAAARLIVEERGHPERQREIVDALDDDTAVALCIWLRDPQNASGLIKQARAKARKRG